MFGSDRPALRTDIADGIKQKSVCKTSDRKSLKTNIKRVGIVIENLTDFPFDRDLVQLRTLEPP